MANAPEKSGSVQSVARALRLLDALAASDQEQTASTLSRQAGLPYATVHRLLATLESRGYVWRDHAVNSYSLGPKFVLAGARVGRLMGQWVRPYLAELVEISGETANLAVLDDGYVMYVAQVQSKQQLRMFTEVGNRVLPHATAVGKAMLAQLPDAEVDDYLGRFGLPPRTHRTITDPARFKEELERVVRTGFGLDDEEGELGVRCIAVPLLDVLGTSAAISVSGPAGRVDEALQRRLVPEMQRIARAIGTTFDHDATGSGIGGRPTGARAANERQST